jgi:cytochrome c peroxidase
MWDGRRDSAFSQVFSPIENPLELNSSRLFVAQQVALLYRAEYEAIFGPLPSLDAYPALAPSEAGCTAMPADPVHEGCAQPGHDDASVTRVVVNVGKAIQAYTRRLSCGRGRFDAWMDGDETALTADEKAGAALFVGKGACASCHSGPFLTDRAFHNLGVPGQLVPFTGVFTDDDPGAGQAVDALRADTLNTKGPFADAYDGRLDELPGDASAWTGAFHTPSLRCVSRRPSFMHNAQFRSLEDAVDFFSKGSASSGYVGKSENYPRNLSSEERAQLVAFLKSLDGTGPEPALREAPVLP